MIIIVNGEVLKIMDYADDEKLFDQVFYVDLPEVEEGDLIEVKLKTKCSRSFVKQGRLEIE